MKGLQLKQGKDGVCCVCLVKKTSADRAARRDDKRAQSKRKKKSAREKQLTQRFSLNRLLFNTKSTTSLLRSHLEGIQFK